MTREELLNRLYVLLGGRVAEEIVFSDVSTGAQNDLQRATDIARSMVTEYGMSSRLGLITYARDRRPMFLDIAGAGHEKEYSERTAQEIDEEMATLMDDAHQKVRSILTEKREILERIATVLLEQEVIEGEAVKKFAAEVKQGDVNADVSTGEDK
jgi:cell division protease FtsH